MAIHPDMQVLSRDEALALSSRKKETCAYGCGHPLVTRVDRYSRSKHFGNDEERKVAKAEGLLFHAKCAASWLAGRQPPEGEDGGEIPGLEGFDDVPDYDPGPIHDFEPLHHFDPGPPPVAPNPKPSLINRAWTKMKEHPYITAAVITSFVAATIFTVLSAGDVNTVCYQDAKIAGTSWCRSEDSVSRVFTKFEADSSCWMPSDDILAKRSFEEISGGASFIYSTVTRYFLRNPLEVILGFFH